MTIVVVIPRAKFALGMGVTVIRGKKNIGCSAAKNILLTRTTSDWIHFHDADDELLPNFMRLARKWIELSSAPDVILFDYEYRDNDSGALLSYVYILRVIN